MFHRRLIPYTTSSFGSGVHLLLHVIVQNSPHPLTGYECEGQIRETHNGICWHLATSSPQGGSLTFMTILRHSPDFTPVQQRCATHGTSPAPKHDCTVRKSSCVGSPRHPCAARSPSSRGTIPWMDEVTSGQLSDRRTGI